MPDSPATEFEITDDLIAEAVGRVLDGYVPGELPVEADWLCQEVGKARDRIEDETRSERREFAEALRRRQAGIWAWRLLGIAGWKRSLSLLLVLILAVAAIAVSIWWLAFVEDDLAAPLSLAVIITSALLIIVVGLGVATLGLGSRLLRTETESRIAGALALVTEATLLRAQEITRATINSRIGDEDSRGALLYETDSSGLVETTTHAIVDSDGVSDLERFVREHSTSAIGIAGPRGCGKTTIISRLTDLDGYLGVYIRAPVFYEAADFVRVVHAEVAQQILRSGGAQEQRFEHRGVERLFRKRIVLGLGCFATGILTITLNMTTGVPKWMQGGGGVLGATGLALGLVGVLVFLSSSMSIWTSFSKLMRPGEASGRKDIARDELHALKWKTTLQSKDKLAFKIFSALSLDTEEQVGRDQRERSHPERVADLRDFLLRLRFLPDRTPVIIAIDELDKIASPEKAIEAVNGLKDLFHISDTHFVVSVSEDALDSFALRGVPVRDVFDSSFDTVMRVRPFTPADSWSLLRRRAPLFNEWAALLCHVIAGGLPRDLVRAARRCVELCTRNGGPLPVAELAAGLVKDEALDVVEAAIRRTRTGGEPSRWLMTSRRRIDERGLTSLTPDELFADWIGGATEPGAAVTEPTPIETDVGVLLLIMITTADLFAVTRTSEDWRDFAVRSAADLERLASARASLAVSHVDALDRLVSVREEVGLAPIPAELTARLRAPAPAREEVGERGAPCRLFANGSSRS
ncbi:P-loop NTPase fold protein [Actinocorallia longicatena]|uniref:KAP-like P-loop domain-containing protein n=1 Tax=Actinocorallia longicatena TaxID=111803 RepID=A0ABP6QIF7_9ACTN